MSFPTIVQSTLKHSWARVVAWLVTTSALCAIPLAAALLSSDEALARLAGVHAALVFVGAFVACLILCVVAFVCLRCVGIVRIAWAKKLFVPTWLGIGIPALVMLVCWLPYLVAFAPGTMGWDTGFQISQCYPNHGPILSVPWSATKSYVDCRFSDHHPVFTTMVFGLFALGSEKLTGSWNMGLTIYIALQAIAMSLSFSLLCMYMRRIGCPALLCLVALCFFCLLPPFAINAATVIKDTLFSWVFVLYFILICEVARTHGSALESNRFLIALVVATVWMCLTKKTGLYIVLPTAVIFCIALRSNVLRMLAPAIAAAVLMVIVLPRVIFPLINAIPGGKQEMLGTPLQQTALVVLRHGEELPAEERAAIDAVVDYGKIGEAYDPTSVDPVKFLYRWDSATNEDVLRYVGTWVSEGTRYPGAYVRAAWDLLQPFFDPSARMALYTSAGGTKDNGDKTYFFEATQSLREALLKCYSVLMELPGIGFLYSNALYAWVIPVAAFMSVLFFDRKAELMLPFVPVALVVLSVLLSPAALSRYLFPLLYTAPLLVGVSQRAIAKE